MTLTSTMVCMVATYIVMVATYTVMVATYTVMLSITGEEQVNKAQWDMLYTVLTVTSEGAQGTAAPSRTLVYRCPPDSRVYPHVAVACHLGLKHQLNKPQGANEFGVVVGVIWELVNM